MIVLQQIKVLPRGAKIHIMDGSEIVQMIKKSTVDDTLLFDSVESSMRYYKVYSIFRVHKLDVELINHRITMNCCPEEMEVIYLIQIREGCDEG